MNLVLNINLLHLDDPEFVTIRNTPSVAQIQNSMRDARMQTYRAASASGGFANIDLNPKRPTANRTAIKMTKARNRYLTRGQPGRPPDQYHLGHALVSL